MTGTHLAPGSAIARARSFFVMVRMKSFNGKPQPKVFKGDVEMSLGFCREIFIGIVGWVK